MPPFVEILGFIAGLIYSTSTIPQTLKMVRLKSGKAVSSATYGLQSASLFLWLIYGIFHDLPLFTFWTTIALLLTLVVLYMKLVVWRD